MKSILILMFCLMPLGAQINSSVRVVGSAPSGACRNNERLQIVATSGAMFWCSSGTWVDVTPSSSGAVWGSITGTLSGQTDLQTALDGKATTSIPVLTTSSVAGLSAEVSLGALADNSIVAVDVAAGTATPRAAVASDVVGLWTACGSGYMKGNGACDAGGGASYNAAQSYFYQWLPGTPANHGIVGATNPTVQHINFPNQLIGRVAFSNNAGVGAGAVARIGIFEPGCQTKLYESDAYTGVGGTTTYITFPSQINLSGGTYCVMTGSNSGTFTVGYASHSTLLNNAMNNTVSRTGVCQNGMVGSGATATLPNACGAITSGTLYYQYIWLP